MAYYPVFVEVQDARCVVIGGGPVAEGKVERLRAVGAAVTVVAPALTPRLAALSAAREIRHVGREYRRGDLHGAWLAFVAVDGGVAAAVAREARALGIWLNAADDPAWCDFIVPAVLQRGALTIAVATDGQSPALARVVRDWLDAELPDDVEALVAAAARVRRELRAAGQSRSADVWRAALADELAERLRHRLGVHA